MKFCSNAGCRDGLREREREWRMALIMVWTRRTECSRAQYRPETWDPVKVSYPWIERILFQPILLRCWSNCLPLPDNLFEIKAWPVNQTEWRYIGSSILEIFQINCLQVQGRENVIMILGKHVNLLRVPQNVVNIFPGHIDNQVFNVQLVNFFEYGSVLIGFKLPNDNLLLKEYFIFENFLKSN